MSNPDVYVKCDNDLYYRSPIIRGTYPQTIKKRDGSVVNQTTSWMIRFDMDVPRLIIERKVHPERPVDPLVILNLSGVFGSLRKGRGKSGGYVDFMDDQNHVPALEYEISIFRAIKHRSIAKHLGTYKAEDLPPNGVMVYDFV